MGGRADTKARKKARKNAAWHRWKARQLALSLGLPVPDGAALLIASPKKAQAVGKLRKKMRKKLRVKLRRARPLASTGEAPFGFGPAHLKDLLTEDECEELLQSRLLHNRFRILLRADHNRESVGGSRRRRGVGAASALQCPRR